jgi:hypothetical protein
LAFESTTSVVVVEAVVVAFSESAALALPLLPIDSFFSAGAIAVLSYVIGVALSCKQIQMLRRPR